MNSTFQQKALRYTLGLLPVIYVSWEGQYKGYANILEFLQARRAQKSLREWSEEFL